MVQTTVSMTVDAEVFMVARAKADSEKGNLSLICESALREYAKLPTKEEIEAKSRVPKLYERLTPAMRAAMRLQCTSGVPIPTPRGNESPFLFWATILNRKFGPVPIVNPEEVAFWCSEVRG